MRPRQLTDPREDNGIHEADANACNDASAQEHVGILAGCLDSGADEAKPRPREDAVLAAKLVAHPSFYGHMLVMRCLPLIAFSLMYAYLR